MSSDPEELLLQQREVGQFDSTGTFTLALAKGLETLSQFQLRGAAEGVLKLLQGPILQEPAAIWVETSSEEFALSWADPQNPIEGAELARNFQSLLLDSHGGPAHDMALGLCSFAQEEPLEMWWTEWTEPSICA